MTKELTPVNSSIDDFKEAFEEILRFFQKSIYLPIILEMGLKKNEVIENDQNQLLKAIHRGQLTYSNGKFKGRFTATLSKELRRLGAQWDRTQGSWNIPQSKLPIEVKIQIQLSEARFIDQMKKLDRTILSINVEDLVEKFSLTSAFDTALFKFDRRFAKTIENISVKPKLTEVQRVQIAETYNQNMKKYIKDFTEKEISSLREKISKRVLMGERHEAIVKEIQKSYSVSENKAKFLARQETKLMVSAYKQAKYEDAGIKKYRWSCSAGSALHPVRPAHKALNGKVFSWDDPPITTEPGEPVRRNHPQEDYNCRCTAIPIVEF